jgi:putative chitinase
VYADRGGNGDEASGDGWRYRGRGCIQITFKNNYARCGSALGLDLVTNPELLLEPLNAARSAGWFWKAYGLDAYDDDDDVTRETRIINGGTLGLADRKAIFDRALKEWA